MKVLQIIDNLDLGGAERMAVNMANAFCDHAIANVLCVTRESGAFQKFLHSDCRLYILHKKHVADLPAFIKLIRIIKTHQPDVIHAHSSSFFWAALTKVYFRKKVLVWHDHRPLNLVLRIRGHKLLKLFSIMANGIIVVSRELKDRNVRQTFVPEKSIRFIRNFPYVKLNARCEKQTDEINILCLANLRPQKNHSLLIRSFARLLAMHPDKRLRLWIAGKSFDSVYDRGLLDLVHALKVDHQVLFLGNVQDTDQLLSRAQIGVLSSDNEGLPISLLEYGLAALPVLVTDVGHCREVLDNGRCGWLVPSKDADGFTKALEEIIVNWPVSREKGARLLERVNKEYGAGKFIQEYLSFVDSLQTNKPSTSAAGSAAVYRRHANQTL